jgi:acyl-CoA thioesterase FadM
VRCSRIGQKSLDLLYTIRDVDSGQEMASGQTVLVAYDYHRAASVLVPDTWRRALAAYDTPSEG